MSYPKIKTLNNNPKLTGMAELLPNVVFSTETGVTLHMQILKPWRDDTSKEELKPLIVFLQGSAWTFPNVNYELLQLAEYARMGYVVATITHRSFLEGHPAPAFLQDTKTAIRFLRKNAEEYGIDPDHVCFWGTSSGGNTSLLVALTGDDPQYKTKEYPEFSDSVSIAIDCFGPTDLTTLFKIEDPTPEIDLDFTGLFGGNFADHFDLIKEISPLLRIQIGEKYPPVLLIHGDADTIVPYEQSEIMYKALIENNNDAELICIKDAPHEGSFWSRELHVEIMDFIKRKLV